MDMVKNSLMRYTTLLQLFLTALFAKFCIVGSASFHSLLLPKRQSAYSENWDKGETCTYVQPVKKRYTNCPLYEAK